MTIDWSAFTPWSALVGGAMIGLAAALYVLFNGRIAGISGILGSLLGQSCAKEKVWPLAFIFGLIVSPLGWLAVAGQPTIEIDAGFPLLVIAGVLVGLSTRYGAGCTSGHGVCGISRMSPRSLVATVAFMGSGFVTVFIVRHVIGA